MRESLYWIPDGCICQGDGLFGMNCGASEHAVLREVKEARDERDRLRAERDAMQMERDKWRNQFNDLNGQAEFEQAQKVQAQAERDAAQAEAAGLREALESLRTQPLHNKVWDELTTALARTPAQHRDRIVAKAIDKYIDDHGQTCDCCQHVMIDVTAAKNGGPSHCVAGDPEGDGQACANGLHADAERKRLEKGAGNVNNG